MSLLIKTFSQNVTLNFSGLNRPNSTLGNSDSGQSGQFGQFSYMSAFARGIQAGEPEIWSELSELSRLQYMYSKNLPEIIFMRSSLIESYLNSWLDSCWTVRTVEENKTPQNRSFISLIVSSSSVVYFRSSLTESAHDFMATPV